MTDTSEPSFVAEPPGQYITTRPAVLPPTHKATIRAELRDLVVADLLGPKDGPTEEVSEGKVSERYLVGILAPKHLAIVAEEQDELAADGAGTPEEGTPEAEPAQNRTMLPSSLGLTFCVDGNVKRIRVVARWGWYRKIKPEQLKEEKDAADKPDFGGKPWTRTQVEKPLIIDLEAGPIKPRSASDEQPEVVVRGVVRRRPGESEWSVSLFLVNGQSEPKKLKDTAWLFQTALEVTSVTPDAAIFTRRLARRNAGRLEFEVAAELKGLEMAYRKRAEFAVGHGIAIHAEADPVNPQRARKIVTRAIPEYEVPLAKAPSVEDIPELAGLVLDMADLAETADADFGVKLQPLVYAYGEWIKRQRLLASGGDAVNLLDGYAEAADRALTECESARTRIADGIATLGRYPKAADAFRFANRAMWQQRIHTIYAEDRRRGSSQSIESVDVAGNRTWRPFQLAFILLNLPALTDLNHAERVDTPNAVADLLWFPTGGGKTEAYLGLTAYTLGIRRLQGVVEGRSGQDGVAVLMRYTLRLLTLQQFQRATALICACETIRRDDVGKWGAAPFRIGLWVGNKTTPGTTEQSEQAILKYNDAGSRAGLGDPAQLTNCPWCGSEIKPGTHVKVEKVPGRTLMYCGDPLGRCLFTEKKSEGEGLPAVVVDEEIYSLLPSLLIATVDKFAQMPWNGKTQMLFGQVNARCTRHGFRSPSTEDTNSHPKSGKYPAARTEPHGPLRPPDLIIQDELHLISGPLGTMVGLYETAVDLMSTWQVNGKAVRPKVIASTATIRNARMQVMKTFARRVAVFPPQGLDSDDNFFSVQQNPTIEDPGRLYMGICAPGRRLKAVLIRVYLAYLSSAQQIFEKYESAADPWMTLVGYFNSMRELGGMRRLVDDEIKTGLSHMPNRGLPKRRIGQPEELTSRRSAGDIPRILDRLEKQFGPNPAPPRPIDVMLATNMVSVGVDVRRLGLMVVANQPKSTSEYIQATSRVGRSSPGLVCTVLNWARPRDVSHYERFEHYHATFYQHVEALSVTPFAARALDRGLAALLVAGIRLGSSEYNTNGSAQKVDSRNPLVDGVKNSIIHRAEAVGPQGAEIRVRQQLDSLLDIWQTRARRMSGGAHLGYTEQRDGLTKALISPAGDGQRHAFTCLNSLRDVEPMVNLILDDRGFDDVSNATPTIDAAGAGGTEDIGGAA